MAKTLNITNNRSFGGQSSQVVSSISANLDASAEPVGGIIAALPGELTTRTDANTGVVTMETGHGITNGTGDVYWSGGSRRGMTLTVSTDEITIDGGAGDDLPTVNTDMTVRKPVSYDLSVLDGDDAVWAWVYSALTPTMGDGYIAFLDDMAADVKVFPLSGALPADSWDGVSVATNPFAGVVISSVTFSHGELSSVLMGASIGYD